MKICLVTQQLKNVFSGVGLYSKNILNHLSSENHTITVIVPEDQVPPGKQLYHIESVKNTNSIRSQARWMYYSCQFNEAINRLERKTGFDIIHFTDVRDSYFCCTKSPKVANINDTYTAELHSLKFYKNNYIDWIPRFFYYHFAHLIEACRISNLDYIIANSHYTYRIIKNQYSLPDSKLLMCYKSVDIDRYKDVRRNRDLINMQDNIKILFVGGNMQRKGLIDLIKAIEILKKDFPGIHLTVAGDDKFIPKYQEMCIEKNVDSNVDFLGWVSQDKLRSLYQSATVFIMPSLTEALGVVFLEAMAAGVPVIATDVGGIPEIIEHEQNGLLVPVHSPESIVEEVHKMANNPDLTRKLIQNGYATVQKFSVDQMMVCTQKIYSKINTHGKHF